MIHFFVTVSSQPMVGEDVGEAVGVVVGEDVGDAVGEDVGVAVGDDVGEAVGVCVGVVDGVAVLRHHFPSGPALVCPTAVFLFQLLVLECIVGHAEFPTISKFILALISNVTVKRLSGACDFPVICSLLPTSNLVFFGAFHSFPVRFLKNGTMFPSGT
eukprot:CAMPEP_0168822738 /NCGR_PEP_ID=MMETSP0726-20121227/10134_1 /TAXON_ID=265536 /ORGANISM="Amphiprora sp., Strain CCMP467" /LENGTH=157 /DNA_ID=CAMNT_0008875519 /DNA_START=324 /DNA_END=796 /DNA_ORIENTATION=-